MESLGIEIVERIPCLVQPGLYNQVNGDFCVWIKKIIEWDLVEVFGGQGKTHGSCVGRQLVFLES